MALGQNIVFLANGYDLAGYLQEFDAQAEGESVDASVLANNYRSKEQGFQTGVINASGKFDTDATDADTLYDVMKSAFAGGTENVITASFGMVSTGQPAVMMNAIDVKNTIKTPQGALITVDIELQSNNAYNAGVWLYHDQLDAGTNNGTSVDNGAATTNGGLFHVHLFNDDATDCDFKIQHSTNNSVWADLAGAEVNNLSATHASGSATVAAGTTVNRHIRAVATITGGNTILVSAAFARR